MKKTTKYILVAILALAAIVPLWFFLNNLQPLSPGLYSFAVLCIVGVALFLKLFAKDLLQRVRITFMRVIDYKYFNLIAIIFITLLTIITRLYFYTHFVYAPVSDPVTFYDSARNIANGQGLHGDSYPAFFPYLAAYDNTLGIAMKIIGNPWLATIFLNTAFDIGGAFIAYFLIKRLVKPTSKLPVLMFTVWLLSPFTILFSIISLPINIVSFFIITTIFLVLLLIDKIAAKKLFTSLILAMLLGITMGIGNCFRPVFIVSVIALFLVFVYVFIVYKKRNVLLLLCSSFILIVAIFFGIQKLEFMLVANETGLNPATNSSGWSIYVGSNSATNGTWNIEDQNRISQICKDQDDFTGCQQKLQKAGLERYKTQGLLGTANLFVRKLYVFSSDQSNAYNVNDSLTNYTNSTTQKVIGIYITLFIGTLFLLSTCFLYVSAKNTKLKGEVHPAVLFIALLVVGFFLSDMFVESAERYAQIMYPLFIIIAVLSLQLFKNKTHYAH